MSVAIRQATPADLPALRAIAQAAYAPYIPRIGRRPAPMDADYAAHVAAGHAHVAGPGPEGFVVFWPQAGTMMLDNVAVHPSAAGRGLGRALIAHCEATARRLGCDAVHLYTNAAMAENLTLYPRLGFRETGRRREAGFDRVSFAKTLRGADPAD